MQRVSSLIIKIVLNQISEVTTFLSTIDFNISNQLNNFNFLVLTYNMMLIGEKRKEKRREKQRRKNERKKERKKRKKKKRKKSAMNIKLKFLI